MHLPRAPSIRQPDPALHGVSQVSIRACRSCVEHLTQRQQDAAMAAFCLGCMCPIAAQSHVTRRTEYQAASPIEPRAPGRWR